MVKNNTGGSKTKSFARKSIATTHTKLRLSEDPDEKYAQVTKMYGEMCEVICDDNISRKCFIRGKFRGKGKRNSFIRIGEVILVGTRSWASDDTKCDLLEVYSPQEVMQLKNNPKVPTEFLTTVETSKQDEVFEFSNITKEYDIMPKDISADPAEEFVLDEVEEINIDDI
jgi:initiation factor 1A